ncbi:nuclear pore complex protein Nup50 [Bacillus rossius redtenbacheri]|uniref:nuclear pore complex protein Nup50 n=1 Tax=Bacillus rossius redtenbacheri TaxID=93214 RepID=UPI002FDE54DF
MAKRVATTKLDHDNWDAEESPEDAGTYSSAPTHVLKRRVILKAQRRGRTANSAESGSAPAVPNIFRDIKLTGVPSAAPSFSFLSKNESEPSKTETPSSVPQPTFVFSSTAPTSVTLTKTAEKMQTAQSSNTVPENEAKSASVTNSHTIFETSGTSAETKSIAQNTSSRLFSNKTSTMSSGATATTGNAIPTAPLPQTSFGNIFGNPARNPQSADAMREKAENRTDTGQFSFAPGGKKARASAEDLKELLVKENANKSTDLTSANDFIDKDKYYLMLNGLNKSIANWIKENVDKNPHCILTPIFSDYINYLNDIKTKYGKVRASGAAGEKNEMVPSVSPVLSPKRDKEKVTVNGKDKDQSTGFLLPVSLGCLPQATASASKPQAPTPFSSFTFTSQQTSSKPEAGAQFVLPTVGNTAEATSFGSKQESTSESTAEKAKDSTEDDDAEPPEPAATPVVEEGAVYSKRCKVFVKKAGSYQDRGVGTAFIKPVVDGTKTQLVVRADTVLGNVLLNTLVSAAVPIQRVGPNNVAVVCVPTPDEKPPPTTVLLRVKTAADADELHDSLVSHKK